MGWLSQNWIWLAFAVGMVVMMRHGGAGGCCGGGNGHHNKRPATEDGQTKNASAGSCCGGAGHNARDKHADAPSPQAGNAAVDVKHQREGAAQS
jgi:hypothetical protein